MTHRLLLRLAWALVVSVGAYATKTELARMLPMLFAAEDKGRRYDARQTAGWVDKISAAVARTDERKDFARFIAAAPELLDTTALVRGL